MQLRAEKGRANGEATKSTPRPGAGGAPEMTAKVHFYLVRTAGDQLRWETGRRAGKMPDRMVGR
jgi:hypothetical protein